MDRASQQKTDATLRPLYNHKCNYNHNITTTTTTTATTTATTANKK